MASCAANRTMPVKMQRIPCGVRFATADTVDALGKAILSSRVMTMAKCRANRPQGEAINFSHWSGVGSTAASPAQAGILIRMSLVGGGAKVAFRGAGCRLLLNSVPVPASVSVGSEAALIQGALEYSRFRPEADVALVCLSQRREAGGQTPRGGPAPLETFQPSRSRWGRRASRCRRRSAWANRCRRRCRPRRAPARRDT